MGKKKAKAGQNTPDALKDLGNKSFSIKKYEEAIDYYTQAIELSQDKPNHVYFANRANAKLELKQFISCVEDCDAAIQIDPKYVKSYIRKAKAQQLLIRFQDALDTALIGLTLDPDNGDLKETQQQLNQEIEADSLIPKDHPERQKFERLHEWMDKGGSERSKLRLRFYESTHRGVHAATNIMLNDIVLTIPYDQFITMAMCCATPVGKQMVGQGYWFQAPKANGRFHHSYMAVYLLTELYRKRSDPSYKGPHDEFLEILPDNVDDFPSCFTEEEKALLAGCGMTDQMEAVAKQYTGDYKYIGDAVPDFKQFSFEDYRRFHILSQSRSFLLWIDGQQEIVMIPYADMMNHKSPMECDWFYDNKNKCFSVEAVQNIPFGQPIYYSYGDLKSTKDLFQDYGFVLYPHEHDEKSLTLEMLAADQDVHYQLKQTLLSDTHYRQKLNARYDLKTPQVSELLGFARWVTFDDADISYLHLARTRREQEYLAELKQQGTDVSDPNSEKLKGLVSTCFKGHLPTYDKQNELKAWQLIKQNVLKALEEYPNSLDQDNKLLEQNEKDNKLTFNEKNCIMYRKGEKELCNYLLSCADKASELADLTCKEARLRVIQWEGHDKRCEAYFKDLFCPLLP